MKYLTETTNTLQSFSVFNWKDIRRNYNWKLLSEQEDQEGTVKIVKEYKTGIMDLHRPVAVFEKTKQGAKLINAIKKLKKNNNTGK